ncbi:Ger(x)C family spore germination protein [Paenibacillus sp. SI8]|uniref:Ger(x)C family spore germination protein n=1 Tax=unclassified Paenibacillus TaxID=185978 RepID=UPI003465B375
MKTSWLAMVLLLSCVMLMTGCWNRRELSDLSIVTAIGIDKAAEENEYRFSFQIINPREIASGPSGGGGGRNSPVSIVSGTGATLFEAIRKTSQIVPRQMFFAHIQLVVIGESLAKEGIADLFDLFERAHEARMTSDVMIARGTSAESVISMLTIFEKIPANAAVGKLKFTSAIWSENIKVGIDDVIRALTGEGVEPVISGIRINGDPQKGTETSNLSSTQPKAMIQISGIALFREGKLAAWLDGDNARGFMWAKNKMKSTVVKLDCKNKKGGLGIEVTGSKTKIDTEIRDGEPTMHVRIREEGNINEVKCATDYGKTEEVAKSERAWSEETKREVLASVKAAKQARSDVFGFGTVISRKAPNDWKRLKKSWADTFADLQVEVEVESFIRRPGMRLKPYIAEVEKKGS